MEKFADDFNIKNYLPAQVSFPDEDLDDYVRDSQLKNEVEFEYLSKDYHNAVTKAFRLLENKVKDIQDSGILSVINYETINIKLAGSIMMLDNVGPEKRMYAALYAFKFIDITLRLLEY